MLNVTLLVRSSVELYLTVHLYTPCRSRPALRRVSEKSPLMKSLVSQLKPSFICSAALVNEAMSEPLVLQLTVKIDFSILSPFIEGGNVTLQGRVTFVFGLACISLGDTVSREKSKDGEKIKKPFLHSTHWCSLVQQRRASEVIDTIVVTFWWNVPVIFGHWLSLIFNCSFNYTEIPNWRLTGGILLQ